MNEYFNVFRVYLEMALLMGLSFSVFSFIHRFFRRSIRSFSKPGWLRISYLILLSSLALPLLMVALPKDRLLRPKAQVWSGVDRVAKEPYALITMVSVQNSDASLIDKQQIRVDKKNLLRIAVLFLFGIWISILFLMRRFFTLKKFLRGQIPIRCLGKVRILASQNELIPFSTRFLGKAYVIVPEVMLLDAKHSRIAIFHELQHHRSRDTSWILFVEWLKCFFYWNPAIYLWSRLISQLQEFSCDEVLIGRRNFSSRDYGSCLLKVAETAVGIRRHLVGTTSMAACSDSQLKRRIKMMLEYKKERANRGLPLVFAIGTIALLASVAFAARSAIQDRRISIQEARKLAATTSSEIPITVNDLVLRQLNRFVGTPDGRKFVKESLTRLENYRAMIERKILQYKMPMELLAVPVFESGCKNTYLQENKRGGAGLWGFIKKTAIKYGLAVSDDFQTDERLDEERETDAAMRYLKHINFENEKPFFDWRLSIKAYNEGETHVQELIKTLGTRDPWELERAEPREHYLSGLTAIILIMKNPRLLD